MRQATHWAYGALVWAAMVAALVCSARAAQAEEIDADVRAWAEWLDLDEVALAGAVNTTGLHPEEYLVATGHVERAPVVARRFTPDDTLAAIAAVEPALRGWIRATVGCETGWTWDPYAVGDGGLSLGAAQLHRDGLRPTFYAWGYTDLYNPFQAVAFIEAAFKAGLARHWSCA